MITLKIHKVLLGVLLGLLVFSSCTKRKPSNVYMPDMYYTAAYDPYQEAKLAYEKYLPRDKNDVPLFKENYYQTALTPVVGSVPHTGDGLLPIQLANDIEGYMASKNLNNPLDEEPEKTLARGKKLYGQNCAVCHGEKGNGKGSIVQSGAYSGVPNYKDREITVGSIYYVIMYGKNAMGSYASQLKNPDRWRVAEYVMQLKKNL